MAAAPVLEFERPIAELEKQIEELKRLASEQSIDVAHEIAPLEKKLGDVRVQIYQNLTPLQRVQVARMSRRPFTSDYIQNCTATGCSAKTPPSWRAGRASTARR